MAQPAEVSTCAADVLRGTHTHAEPAMTLHGGHARTIPRRGPSHQQWRSSVAAFAVAALLACTITAATTTVASPLGGLARADQPQRDQRATARLDAHGQQERHEHQQPHPHAPLRIAYSTALISFLHKVMPDMLLLPDNMPCAGVCQPVLDGGAGGVDYVLHDANAVLPVRAEQNATPSPAGKDVEAAAEGCNGASDDHSAAAGTCTPAHRWRLPATLSDRGADDPAVILFCGEPECHEWQFVPASERPGVVTLGFSSLFDYWAPSACPQVLAHRAAAADLRGRERASQHGRAAGKGPGDATVGAADNASGAASGDGVSDDYNPAAVDDPDELAAGLLRRRRVLGPIGAPSGPIPGGMAHTAAAATLVSNCAVPPRNFLIEGLSELLPMASLGRCHHNTDVDGVIGGERAPQSDGTAAAAARYAEALAAYSHYPTVLAVENNNLAGYFTEKMVNALAAGAVPLYMGSATSRTAADNGHGDGDAVTVQHAAHPDAYVDIEQYLVSVASATDGDADASGSDTDGFLALDVAALARITDAVHAVVNDTSALERRARAVWNAFGHAGDGRGGAAWRASAAAPWMQAAGSANGDTPPHGTVPSMGIADRCVELRDKPTVWPTPLPLPPGLDAWMEGAIAVEQRSPWEREAVKQAIRAVYSRDRSASLFCMACDAAWEHRNRTVAQ